MAAGPSDFERTLAFSESAVHRLRAHRHPAYPRNYELWYTYATGYNAPLNRAINEAIERTAQISEADLDLLYETYLSPLRLSERVDHVGTRILAEILEIAEVIKNGQRANLEFAETLAAISSEIKDLDRSEEVIGKLALRLLAATNGMVKRTGDLEAQLGRSQDEMQELHHTLEVVRAESLTDPLTGLANRKFLQSTLDRALSDADGGATFSILVVDIDHFKTFNDNYGHLTGDQVLRLVALALKQNVKGQDLAARFGGEEFAIVLPETDLAGAVAVADRVRRAVMTKDLVKRSTGERLGRVTVSIGVATWRRGDTGQTVIDRADQCLYAAKRGGRNKVVSETNGGVAEDAGDRVA